MKKYLFLDLETTGLDPREQCILEVAVAVTDAQLNILEVYTSPIYVDSSATDKMDQWCISTHTKSGLLEDIESKGLIEDQVEQKLIAITKEHFNGQKIILAGNSIHFDRSFLKFHMPEFESRLHYRMLDVSSFNIVIEDYFQMKCDKKYTHRALPDVLESIQELRDYISFFEGEK